MVFFLLSSTPFAKKGDCIEALVSALSKAHQVRSEWRSSPHMDDPWPCACPSCSRHKAEIGSWWSLELNQLRFLPYINIIYANMHSHQGPNHFISNNGRSIVRHRDTQRSFLLRWELWHWNEHAQMMTLTPTNLAGKEDHTQKPLKHLFRRQNLTSKDKQKRWA